MIASFISYKKLAMEEQIPGFIDFFKQVPDHRIKRHKLHAVEETL